MPELYDDKGRGIGWVDHIGRVFDVSGNETGHVGGLECLHGIYDQNNNFLGEMSVIDGGTILNVQGEVVGHTRLNMLVDSSDIAVGTVHLQAPRRFDMFNGPNGFVFNRRSWILGIGSAQQEENRRVWEDNNLVIVGTALLALFKK